MQDIDKEVNKLSIDFMERAVADDKPFFVWHNPSAMHEYTFIEDEIRGQAGLWQSEYHDRMIEHDKDVGELLDKLDDLGVADNTLVVYVTDNGAMINTKPDGATTPFRSEKVTSWEGGFRGPMMIRWPGVVEPGQVSNEITSLLDFLPTILDAAGDPNMVDELKAGYKAGNGKTYKVHPDGHSLVPYISGKAESFDRDGYLYFADDGDFFAVRVNNWKFIFAEQPAAGTFAVWAEPYKYLRMPKVFNLRTDPYETADFGSNTYWDFISRNTWMAPVAMSFIGDFVETLKEYPRRAAPPSYAPHDAYEKLNAMHAGAK